jgi:hypothetical protein
MTIRKLETPEWRPFLDVVSKFLEAKNAEVEIAALDPGDQLLAGMTAIAWYHLRAERRHRGSYARWI